jgi:hypothetical protein
MTLNMKALCSFETVYQSTEHNILEDLNFWQHHCGNLNVTVLKINLIWFLTLPFKQNPGCNHQHELSSNSEIHLPVQKIE